MEAAVQTERDLLFEVLGVGDTPNAHSCLHFRMFFELFTLLRLIWTNRGEAKHLQFKLLVAKMNKWNIEWDMMLFNDVKEVYSTHSDTSNTHTNGETVVWFCMFIY